MRDNIKETGRYLRDSSEKRDFAMRRTVPIIPITDRVRDVFDDITPMDMRFNVPKDDTHVNLDIRFLRLPWNAGNSLCGNCHCRTTEYFYGNKDSYILQHDSDPVTVRVYVNNVQTTNFTVSDLDTVILLDTSLDTDVLTITYVYVIDAQCDTGTDTPNYDGGVFSGYQRTYDPSGTRTDIAFAASADHPLAGWGGQATIGPIEQDQTSAPFRSITILAPMIVRIWAVAGFATVSSPPASATFTVHSSIHGVIGTLTVTHDIFSYWGELLSIDLRNYQASAGETIYTSQHVSNFLAGGWGNVGTGETYLYIGRGSFSSPGFAFNGP